MAQQPWVALVTLAIGALLLPLLTSADEEQGLGQNLHVGSPFEGRATTSFRAAVRQGWMQGDLDGKKMDEIFEEDPFDNSHHNIHPAEEAVLAQLAATPVATKMHVEHQVTEAVQNAVRRTMRRAISKAVNSALKAGHAANLTRNQLRSAATDAATRAAQAMLPMVNVQLIETTTKKKAIQVAKAQGKRAAREAALAGKNPTEQAKVARKVARRLAVSFAEVAKRVGMSTAQREAHTQLAAAGAIAFSMLPQDPALVGISASAPPTPAGGKLPAGQVSQAVASKIQSAASEGVSSAKAKAEQVAHTEAKAAGLSPADTAKLQRQSTSAVKKAARDLPYLDGNGAASRSGSNSIPSNASPTPAPRLSPTGAKDAAKEKEKKKVLTKYKEIARKETDKVRADMERAAKQEEAAAKFVKTVATNSLARGLDKALSKTNLKRAAKEATDASTAVEKAVKAAIRKALAEKERLKTANEKVQKAGQDASSEAHRKNERQRKRAGQLSEARTKAAERKTKELKLKRRRANELAHKAIARVVRVAGQKASKRAARITAAAIQKTYLSDSCQRRVQHQLRSLASTAMKKAGTASEKNSLGLKAIRAAAAGVVSEVTNNTVRRNAHAAAKAAKAAAAARGMTLSMQMAAARKAWMAAAPKIKSFCKPAGDRAVVAAKKNPNVEPVKINEHAFVKRAVNTMKKSVDKACRAATKPVVIDGATKAAQHDADYSWQVKMGMKEADKVCRAAVALYAKNAKEMATKMVNRTFHESAEGKKESERFAKEMRHKAQDKSRSAAERAYKKTFESEQKKCMVQAKAKATHAKHSAARGVVRDTGTGAAEEKSKAAYDTAYNQAISDGLSKARATTLGQQAAKRAKAVSVAETKSALRGIAPKSKASKQLQLLRTEARHAVHRAHDRRENAKRLVLLTNRDKRNKHKKRAAAKALRDAAIAEEDAKIAQKRLTNMELEETASVQGTHDSLAMNRISEILSSFRNKAQRKRDHKENVAKLLQSVHLAAAQLHKLGAQLPWEAEAELLRNKLLKADAAAAQAKAKLKRARAMLTKSNEARQIDSSMRSDPTKGQRVSQITQINDNQKIRSRKVHGQRAAVPRKSATKQTRAYKDLVGNAVLNAMKTIGEN